MNKEIDLDDPGLGPRNDRHAADPRNRRSPRNPAREDLGDRTRDDQGINRLVDHGQGNDPLEPAVLRTPASPGLPPRLDGGRAEDDLGSDLLRALDAPIRGEGSTPTPDPDNLRPGAGDGGTPLGGGDSSPREAPGDEDDASRISGWKTYLKWRATPADQRIHKTIAEFRKAYPDITVDQINAFENSPKFWQGVQSNLEWARGNIPALVRAIFVNAENGERGDQWEWIQRAFHYARTGALLGSESEGTVNLASGSKRTGK